MKTNKEYERKREEFNRLCEEDYKTVSYALKNRRYNIMKIKLTNIEKGDLSNVLYEYKRAVISKRQNVIRKNLYKLVEQMLNERKI